MLQALLEKSLSPQEKLPVKSPTVSQLGHGFEYVPGQENNGQGRTVEVSEDAVEVKPGSDIVAVIVPELGDEDVVVFEADSLSALVEAHGGSWWW